MKIKLALLFILIPFLFSCDNKDEATESGNTSVNISGRVEKGPFVSGSSVEIYELDENLNGTGKIFKSTTNNEGFFELNTSTKLASKFVRLSVKGYFFNEVTGDVSNSQIELEALTSIDDSDNTTLNANILTHLEMPRVMYLIKQEKKDFWTAKKQAESELLSAFLISGKSLIPEKVSITTNNTEANILIAISSILLNNRTEGTFSQFIGQLSDDLKDGEISAENKEKIKASSFELNYKKVKQNITDRYSEFGKDVIVGDFQHFVDGKGLGEIGYDYDVAEEITVEDVWQDEKNVEAAVSSVFQSTFDNLKYNFLFEGVYTNTAATDNIAELKMIADHNISANTNLIASMWTSAYKAINRANMVLHYTESAQNDKFKKYKYPVLLARAYNYFNLVNYWGDTPLLTEMKDINDMYFPRTDKDIVIEQIIRDLNEAEKNLPEKPSYTGTDHFSKYFASALLLRVYIMQKDYSKVQEYSNKIINSGNYALADNYNTCFSTNTNPETFHSGSLLNQDNTQQDYLFNKFIKKGDYVPWMRYSEVLLAASEANLKLGNLQRSIELLNSLRSRNNKPLINSTSVQDIEKALLEEWKTDLSNEGIWFFVMKRFGIAEQTLQIPSHKTVLPIPWNELAMNPSIYQNPGY